MSHEQMDQRPRPATYNTVDEADMMGVPTITPDEGY